MTTPTTDEIRGIYAGISNLPLTPDITGWNSDGYIFADVIDKVRPTVIVEVGTWKGRSAIHMANLTRAREMPTVIYCVDCWLPPIGVGLGEFPQTHIPERWDAPTFYQQFLFNVKHAGADDRIIPVRGLTVPIAACLGAWGVQADMIYVDASHDELSVLQDLNAYWPLLRPGGVMFGDDYSSHEGVRWAVNRFSAQVSRAISEMPAAEGTQWVLEAK